MGGQGPVHENGCPVRTLGTPMLVAIDTSTVSDFVNDHPGEAYVIAGALVLLLILLLLMRRQRSNEGGDPAKVSRSDARRAKKEAKAADKAAAKESKAADKAAAKQAKAD